MGTIDTADKINLILNPGFELGTTGWDSDSGAGALTIADETEGADAGSGHCLLATYERPDGADGAARQGTVSQTLAAELAQHLRGRQLSLQLRVASATASSVLAFISQDGGETRIYGGVNGAAYGHGWPGDPDEIATLYEDLRIEGVVLDDAEAASGLMVGVEIRQPGEVRLDNVSLVFGAACVAAEACIPAGVIGYLAAAETAQPIAARRASAAQRSSSSGEASPERSGGSPGGRGAHPDADRPTADRPAADPPKR